MLCGLETWGANWLAGLGPCNWDSALSARRRSPIFFPTANISVALRTRIATAASQHSPAMSHLRSKINLTPYYAGRMGSGWGGAPKVHCLPSISSPGISNLAESVLSGGRARLNNIERNDSVYSLPKLFLPQSSLQ